jgi:hypothetical protein
LDKVHIEEDKPKRGKFVFIRNFNLDEYLQNKEVKNEEIKKEVNSKNKENASKPVFSIKKSIFAGYNKTENSKKPIRIPRFNSSSSTRKIYHSCDSIRNIQS